MAVSPSTTTAAIEALLKWHKTQQNTTNVINPEDDFIYLVLTLKNIPQKAPPNGSHFGIRSTPYKIPLPNAIISSPQACLIIDDRPNSNLTSKQAKEKILTDGVPVSKVIKLSKLKSSYKPFEAKRKLCDSYDMFFADKRVVPLLPKLLGKHFFRSKKLPLGVDLCHKNWKEQIERGFKVGLLSFGSGTCSVVRVARVGMEKDEIVENVNAGVEGVIGFVPKRILGVRSLHLKFSGSVALPLYQSLPDIKLRIDGKDGESVEDVMEIDGAGSDKKGKKKAKRGRIHDVDHEDIHGSDVLDGLDSCELDADETVEKVAKKDGSGKKKRKGNVVDEKKKAKKGKVEEVEEVEKDEPGSAEVVNVKAARKSGKDKKRKENVVVVEEKDTKPSEKKAKKKGEKKVSGDSGKEKKKGRMLAHKFLEKSQSDIYLKKQNTKESWSSFGWNSGPVEDDNQSRHFTDEDWKQLNEIIGYKEGDNSEQLLLNDDRGDVLHTLLEVHMKHNASRLTEAHEFVAELSCENLDCLMKFYKDAKYRLSSPDGLLAESATSYDSLVGSSDINAVHLDIMTIKISGLWVLYKADTLGEGLLSATLKGFTLNYMAVKEQKKSFGLLCDSRRVSGYKWYFGRVAFDNLDPYTAVIGVYWCLSRQFAFRGTDYERICHTYSCI